MLAAVGETLARHFRLLGTQGLVGMAIAGVDMAARDAPAQARGQPLAAVLGGKPTPTPAYGSLRSMTPAAAAAEAEEWIATCRPSTSGSTRSSPSTR